MLKRSLSISRRRYPLSMPLTIKRDILPSTSHSWNTISTPPSCHYSTKLLAGQPLPGTHDHIIAQGDLTKGFPPDEFSARRARLMDHTKHGSVAVVPARRTMFMSNDIPYAYRQNSDFYYFTGFLAPNACLVMHKDKNGKVEEYMFVEEKDDRAEKWNGPRTGVDAVQRLFGFAEARVLPLGALQGHVDDLLTDPQYDMLYYEHNAPPDDQVHNTLVGMFNNSLHERRGGVKLSIISPRQVFDRFRCVKSERELEMLRECGSISGESYVAMMRGTYPGMSEAHIEAFLEFEVRLRGAQRLAYPPVIASGEHRNNIIHYVANDRVLQDGDLVIVDGGAEYYLYSSDITRTYPVSGRFTEAQREIYEAVLRVNEKCIALCNEQSQMDFGSLHKMSEKYTFEELQALGICENPSDVEMFYPHAIGHPMGMDIHEHEPSVRIPFKEGMTITIEPGIYIPPTSETELNKDLTEHERSVLDRIPAKYRGIGVRIEDDVVIGKEKGEVLTSAAPKKVDEIERIMSERGTEPMSNYVKQNFRH